MHNLEYSALAGNNPRVPRRSAHPTFPCLSGYVDCAVVIRRIESPHAVTSSGVLGVMQSYPGASAGCESEHPSTLGWKAGPGIAEQSRWLLSFPRQRSLSSSTATESESPSYSD